MKNGAWNIDGWRRLCCAGYAVAWVCLATEDGLCLDISGVVLDTNDAPLVGATVTVVNQNSPDFTTSTKSDDSGRFAFKDLTDDVYIVSVLPLWTRVAEPPIHRSLVVSNSTDNLELKQFIRTIRLECRVLSTKTRLPVGAKMKMAPASPAMAGVSIFMDPTQFRHKEPDEAGRFHFDRIIPGEEYLTEINIGTEDALSFSIKLSDANEVIVEEYGKALMVMENLTLECVVDNPGK